MGKGTTKRFALTATIAAVAGYIAGILTAPKSGKETRDDIKTTAVRGLAEAEKRLQDLRDDLGKLVSEAKAKSSELSASAHRELEELVDEAKDARDKALSIVRAVKKGAASDRDLDRAVDEAARAYEHLKRYLTK